jgi:hypothetical protein
MSTDGFWAKVLVTDKEWDTVLKRIQDDAIPERAMAMSTGGFWAQVLVTNKEWDTVLKRC